MMRSTSNRRLLLPLGTLLLAGAVGISVFLVARPASVDSQSSTERVPDVAPVTLDWDIVDSDNGPSLLRAKVPGGWLVVVPGEAGGVTYYSDPRGNWGAERKGIPRPRRDE